jgi:hypothetical protein
MKLYTEEQVRKAMMMASSVITDDDEVIAQLTPIELPSDEEIENYARLHGLVHPFVSSGAKWMRNKIGGGKNEVH